MVNINIVIPDELHRELKVVSAIKGITLKELIIKVAEESTKKNKKLDRLLK